MTRPAQVSPVAIIGIGNSMRHDDAIGPIAVACLQTDEQLSVDHPVDLRTLDGEPTRLIEAWRDRRLAIVIDAVRSGAVAGSIHRVEVGRDSLPSGMEAGSSHSAGLGVAVGLGRTLGVLPDKLIVFGIEPGDLSMGEGLSREVGVSLPMLVKKVQAEVATFLRVPVAAKDHEQGTVDSRLS